MVEYRMSRMGSTIEYGLQMCISACAPPNSSVKVVAMTISDGVAMFANCEFISERTYSSSILYTGAQARAYSVNTTSSRPRMMRCSVGVKSRSEEHTSELQSRENLVCRLLLAKKKTPIEK